MDRTVDYLLKKYETKDANEIWTKEHELQYKQNQRNKKRQQQLECIINERKTISRGTFRFTPMQKSRANYLIRNLDFNLGGTTTTEQFLVMIITYIKLETEQYRKLQDYYPLLQDYEIPISTFVKFLIKLNRFHINR